MKTRGRSLRLIPLLVVALFAFAACADGDDASAPTPSAVESSAVETTAVASLQRPPCDPPADETEVVSTAVEGSETAFDIESFDGTAIRANWFPHPDASEEAPAPTVLMGPGWGQAGDTNFDTVGILGSINIATLRAAGYNVLTWDPRGFGSSGGTATVNYVENEGRDVQQLIDWVATLPGVWLDVERDPAVGMIGGSYGGGIQLVTAAIDCRIDALVPIVAWNSLRSSLYRSEFVKLGWAGLLVRASGAGSVDPHVTSAYESGVQTGTLSNADYEWFLARGPGELVEQITAPTLLIHGTIDTLFTLDEAVANYRILTANEVPTAMMWNCDGHGVCLTDPGDPTRVSTAAIAWLDRYVKLDANADTGAGFDTIDQNGVRYVADAFTDPDGEPIEGSGSGTLELRAEGGSGPAEVPDDHPSIVAGLAESMTPAKATNSVDVTVTAGDEATLVMGAPQLRIDYTGTAGSGDRPQRVFAQLVDASTGLVLGNQITPIAVVLDGTPHSISVPLETVFFAAEPGAEIVLQIVASTVAYAEPQFGGQITFDDIEVSLPVTTDLTRAD